MNRLLPPPNARERGQTMILAAITLPVVVAIAALAIGASMVRSADSEVQRTANLSALAAAANMPMLGRPSVSGLPLIPSTLDDNSELPAPPTVGKPGSATAYTTGGIYKALFGSASAAEKNVADKLGIGPLVQSILGSGWSQACTVGEAQYAAGRAKLGRTYAAEKDAGGNPVVPHCAVNGNWNDGTAVGAEHIWVRPEMESTGMYRLQRCMQVPTDCVSQLGLTEAQVLASIGTSFSSLLTTALGGAPGATCLIDPVGTGCPFNTTTSTGLFGSSAVATSVTNAFKSQIQSVTGIAESSLAPVSGSLSTLGGLLMGKSSLTNACSTALGPASGETLCSPGINLASLLPSTFTPRVRVVVHHAVDFPFVPSITGASVGDFDFAEMALARRQIKNAVVVPTLPANFGSVFGSDTSTCLRGKSLLSSVFSNPAFSLLGGTLTVLDSLLGTLVAPLTGGTSTCANADVDSAAASNMTIDLNPTLAVPQKDLVLAANAVSGIANKAANTLVGATVGRPASECDQTPPAAWCVNMVGQTIHDLTDLYNPPSGGSAPTAGEVMQRAAQTGEDVNIVALGKTITIPLGGSAVSAGGVISALTYWIPAFDVVPATVTHYDPAHPDQTTFKISGAPHGLYKGVLLDAKADLYPLCADTPSVLGYCFDQPPS